MNIPRISNTHRTAAQQAVQQGPEAVASFRASHLQRLQAPSHTADSLFSLAALAYAQFEGLRAAGSIQRATPLLTDAITYARKGLQERPDDRSGAELLACALDDRGQATDRSEALALFGEIADEIPDYRAGQINLAVCQLQAGGLEDAKAILKKSGAPGGTTIRASSVGQTLCRG
jgi:tetratricopeptide (TPR) repeat protein